MNEAYLLTSEARPDTRGWKRISEVLDGLVASRARNILLILDATRFDVNLEFGLLSNDFVMHLEREWKRIKEALEKTGGERSFRILCSSSNGQKSWFSPYLRHSPFGLAVAYGLAGGAKADRTGDGNQPDRIISADEVAAFVKTHVEGWVLTQRDSAQVPLLLSHGKDFLLIGIDDNLVTLEQLLEKDKPAAPAAPAEAEAAPPPAEGEKAGAGAAHGQAGRHGPNHSRTDQQRVAGGARSLLKSGWLKLWPSRSFGINFSNGFCGPSDSCLRDAWTMLKRNSTGSLRCTRS